MKRVIISAILLAVAASSEVFAQSTTNKCNNSTSGMAERNEIINILKSTGGYYIKYINSQGPLLLKIASPNAENKHAAEFSLAIGKALKRRGEQFISQGNIKSEVDVDVFLTTKVDLKKYYNQQRPGEDNWWKAVVLVELEFIDKNSDNPCRVSDVVGIEIKERVLDDIYQWKDSIDEAANLISKEVEKLLDILAISKAISGALRNK